MASSVVQDDLVTNNFFLVELILHLESDKKMLKVIRNVCQSWLIAHACAMSYVTSRFAARLAKVFSLRLDCGFHPRDRLRKFGERVVSRPREELETVWTEEMVTHPFARLNRGVLRPSISFRAPHQVQTLISQPLSRTVTGFTLVLDLTRRLIAHHFRKTKIFEAQFVGVQRSHEACIHTQKDNSQLLRLIQHLRPMHV